MFERFTDRARKVMALANQEALRFDHEYIGTEHILLGLVKEGSGVGANVLRNLGMDLRRVRSAVEKLVKRGPTPVTMGKLPQTPRAKRVLEYAIEESRNLHHNYVGTEHILLGLVRETEGIAAQVLTNLGADLGRVRAEVLALLGASADESAALDLPDTAKALAAVAPGASARPVEAVLRNDVAAGLMHVLLCELISRRSAAKLTGDLELVGEYKGIITYIEAAQESLLDSLRRRYRPAAGKGD